MKSSGRDLLYDPCNIMYKHSLSPHRRKKRSRKAKSKVSNPAKGCDQVTKDLGIISPNHPKFCNFLDNTRILKAPAIMSIPSHSSR